MKKLTVIAVLVLIGISIVISVMNFGTKNENPLPEYYEFYYCDHAGCFPSAVRYTAFIKNRKYYMIIDHNKAEKSVKYVITEEQYRECVPDISKLKRSYAKGRSDDDNPVVLKYPGEEKILYDYKFGVGYGEQLDTFIKAENSILRKNTDSDPTRIVCAMKEVFEAYGIEDYRVYSQKGDDSSAVYREWELTKKDKGSLNNICRRIQMEDVNVSLFVKRKTLLPYLGKNTKFIEWMYEKKTGRTMDDRLYHRDVTSWPLRLHKLELKSRYELLMLRYYDISLKGPYLVYTKTMSDGDWLQFYYACPHDNAESNIEFKAIDPITRAEVRFAALRVFLTKGKLSVIPGERIIFKIMFCAAAANVVINLAALIIFRKHAKRRTRS